MSAVGLPNPAEQRSARLLLWAYGCFLLALITVHVTFTDRMTWGDEDGLYNAIYMYQHYGKVTYPMQLQFDYMTIHPPVHYFVVGLLTKLGLQEFHAAAVPLILITLIAFAVIATSAFSLLAKLSLLTGFTLATLVYTPLLTIRPDMEVTFAWFCGMVSLEAARSLAWDNKRLFLGSFFIAYASGLHYWAGAAALVLVAYSLFILLRPAEARPWMKIALVCGGACVFYLPYAAFFVIPHYDAILQMLRGTNATGGGVRASMESQFFQLIHWGTTAWPVDFPAIGRTVFLPITKFHIPPIACASLVLLCIPSLRGLATIGAILPVFVFTMVSRKGGLHYIAPELILYAVAVSVVFFAAISWCWKRLTTKRLLAPYVVASILAGTVLLRSAPAATLGLTWKLVDWDVARAASRRMVGENALVAINQCYDWYTSGATRLYWIVTHIDWPFLQRVDAERRFDSILVLNDWFANRSETIPFPSFYLDGHLSLRGFYFAGRYDQAGTYDRILTVLHLSTHPFPTQGFGYDRARRILNHYTESADGEWMFVTFKAFLDPEQWPKDAIYIQNFDIEQPAKGEPSLFAMVMSRANWMQDRIKYAALGTIRDEVRMDMEEVTVEQLLRDNENSRIAFMTNAEDVK
jgi:hypothetical protein